MIEAIWRHLKRDRSLRVGPISFSFKFRRSIRISRNTPKRLRSAFSAHQTWAETVFERTHKEPERLTDNSSGSPPARPELAMIVGVGPGFGYSLARRLATAGIAVLLVSRNAGHLDTLVQQIRNTGGFAHALGCDATSESSVVDLYESINATYGIPDLVVYSLQNFGAGSVVDIELPAFEDGWKHNCLGAFLVARSAARLMRPRGRGSIVLVGSTSSVLGRAGHLNLAVGKFGQRALAQVLARELWPAGIHVAHLLIDADIREEDSNDTIGTSSDPDQIAESVLSLYRQPRTAWTSEMDIRPWNERFWEHC